VLLLRAKRLSCRNWPTTALMVPENLLEPRFSACNVVRRLMVVHGIKPESLLALSDSVWMAVMLVIDDGMPPTRLLPSKILRQRARERTRSKTKEDIHRNARAYSWLTAFSCPREPGRIPVRLLFGSAL